ncbi:MAG: hypothetical protein Q9169_007035 [Polycauliona sp. 2 TL-2023]
MAPTKPKRPTTRARAPKTPSTSLLHHTHHKPQPPFASSKKDKRIIKHSALLSRIEKSTKPPPQKRRRPSKKLVANLESLAAALPDAPPRDDGVAETGVAKIRHRSLKSKPGAMKKKEKVIAMEKERFNRNMAQMANAVQNQSDKEGAMDASHGTAVGSDGKSQSQSKWAALRNHIQQTMEQRPAV